MSTSQPNALVHASSAYLRSAMDQPTRWNQWGPEAFAQAKAEDKPVLLDIGAVWCHWCHVMDRESYESPEVAEILNTQFIPIKVDRDERPDVDARYQTAVAAMTGQGGWPLTVFLTPDGKPFFGGTYFPPVDAYGRPSFKRILLAISQAFRERRDEVENESDGLMRALTHAEGMVGHSGEFSPRIIEQMVQAALGSFDRVHGGFNNAPKFAHPAVIDLLADWYTRTGEEQVRTVLTTTLENMARGGVYDQLAGGFHRYSVDERWCVPHFEKMAYDNSELLKNYVHAWQATGNPFFADVARDILRWMREWLSDRDRGGYYGSQDADINLDDDGDYFTWTLDEARAVLTPEELAVAAAYYDIGEHGEMTHNHAKNVLWISQSIEQIAAAQSRSVEATAALLSAAKHKMYTARLHRPTPYIDRTLYTNWNALCISATLQAARVLGDIPEQEFALRSLERLLSEGTAPTGELLHVIAYAENGASKRPAGVLDDYAFTALACVDAYESTSDLKWLTKAQDIIERMISGFYDTDAGGFYDIDTASAADAIGVLATRRKPFQDSPTPAGNPAAAIALQRLHALTEDERLHRLAEGTLKVFAGVASQFGIHAGTYGVAAIWMAQPHTQVVIIGTGPEADALYREALAPFTINKIVLRVPDASKIDTRLPAAFAATVSAVPNLQKTPAVALLCTALACQSPIHDPGELRHALRGTSQAA